MMTTMLRDEMADRYVGAIDVIDCSWSARHAVLNSTRIIRSEWSVVSVSLRHRPLT